MTPQSNKDKLIGYLQGNESYDWVENAPGVHHLLAALERLGHDTNDPVPNNGLLSRDSAHTYVVSHSLAMFMQMYNFSLQFSEQDESFYQWSVNTLGI